MSVILLVAFWFSIILTARAQDDVLVLEWEQHWPTFGVGGTCNFGSNNFFVGDVDDDGVIELITGGLTYKGPNYDGDALEAPLRIWNWKGENFTLEASYNWAGTLSSMYAYDLDNDGRLEIITGGHVRNNTESYDSVKIWSWDNQNLVLKATCEGISARSIFAGDVDKDGNPEVLVSGTIIVGEKTFARLSIFQWEKTGLFLEKSAEWCSSEDASANSVYVYDLDKDGDLEIITGGYDNNLTNSSGQLRIWNWNGKELIIDAIKDWRMVEGGYGKTITGAPMGNTVVETLKIGDVDGDGIAEIVTGGFAFDGQKINAQLGIWNWDGNVFSFEKSYEWITHDITEIKAISLSDVNNDGHIEIITSGVTCVYGGFTNGTTPEVAQLRVWSWDGETLKLNQKEDWVIGEGVCAWNVGTGDLNEDGTVEIITVGCMYVSQLCDPDLRIWSLQTATNSESLLNILIELLEAGTIVLVVVIAYFSMRRRHNRVKSK